MSKMINSADQIDDDRNSNAMALEDFEEFKADIMEDELNVETKCFLLGKIREMAVGRRISLNQHEELLKLINISDDVLDKIHW